MTSVSRVSVMSLLLRVMRGDAILATATGFTVSSDVGPLLLTNRHVLTGRHQETGEPLSSTAAIPDRIAVMHNLTIGLGAWDWRFEPLYDDDKPRWHEHPSLGKEADIAALKLTDLNGVQVIPHDLSATDWSIKFGVTDVVSVVGFPFGLQGGGSLAVWATGFVASEPQMDYRDLPQFLIDCRSRPGQSGSPVMAYRPSGVVRFEDGSTRVVSGEVFRILGMYSGRVNNESDLGVVWKTSALQELVAAIS